jgi:predicted signal transduction protein with EAL and GGDEF domain
MGQTLRGTDVQVSFSIGIAVFPEDGTTPEALMERADAALLDAKHTGPAKIVRYRPKAADRAA